MKLPGHEQSRPLRQLQQLQQLRRNGRQKRRPHDCWLLKLLAMPRSANSCKLRTSSHSSGAHNQGQQQKKLRFNCVLSFKKRRASVT
jgi:hypothetical protein